MNLNGTTFCIDPYLTDYVDKNCCTEIIKWKRLYESQINGKDLDFVDYFLFTHTHYDHCDPWTIRDILTTNKKAKFIITAPCLNSLIEYGVDNSRILPASVLKSMLINDVIISSYPAKHDVFHKIENEYAELCFSLCTDNNGMVSQLVTFRKSQTSEIRTHSRIAFRSEDTCLLCTVFA